MNLSLHDIPTDLHAYIVDINRFKIIDSNPLGRGQFGTVYKARDNKTGELVAVKKLASDVTISKTFIREIETISKATHPCIVRLIGFSLKPLSIVSEFIPHQSLFRYILERNKKGRQIFTGTQKTIIAMGIAHAMIFLHSLGIIHRDLKSLNILIDEKLRPKICDFGTARFIGNTTIHFTRQVGTPNWMAPEILQTDEYGPEVDVYSYAMVLSELLTYNPPFYQYKDRQQLMNIIHKERPELPSDTPKELKDLIKLSWSKDPESRPSFLEIYKLFENGTVQFTGTDTSEVKKFAKELSKIKIPNPKKITKKKATKPKHSVIRHQSSDDSDRPKKKRKNSDIYSTSDQDENYTHEMVYKSSSVTYAKKEKYHHEEKKRGYEDYSDGRRKKDHFHDETFPRKKSKRQFTSDDETFPRKKSKRQFTSDDEVFPRKKSKRQFTSDDETFPRKKSKRQFTSDDDNFPRKKSKRQFTSDDEVFPRKKSKRQFTSDDETFPRKKSKRQFTSDDDNFPRKKSKRQFTSDDEVFPRKKSKRQFTSDDEVFPRKKSKRQFTSDDETFPRKKSKRQFTSDDDNFPRKKSKRQFTSDDETFPRKHSKRQFTSDDGVLKKRSKQQFTSEDDQKYHGYDRRRNDDYRMPNQEAQQMRKLVRYNKDSPFIDIDAIAEPRSYTFRAELKKASTALPKIQSRQFMTTVESLFRSNIRPAELSFLLSCLQQIVQYTYHREMFLSLDLHHQLPLTTESVLDSCLDVLLVLFDKTPKSFEDDYIDEMKYLISQRPAKAILLLSYMAKSFDHLENAWKILDLLLSKHQDFFKSSVGAELISTLFFLCYNFADYRRERGKYSIEIFLKGLQAKEKKTIKLSYNALCYFYKKNLNLDYGLIIDHLAVKSLTLNCLRLLIRIHDIPCLPELIHTLLEKAEEFEEATLILLKIAALEDGCIVMLKSPNWMLSEIPILNILRIYLAIMTHEELRPILMRIRQTQQFFIRLCDESDSRILTHVSLIFRKFNVDSELVTKFSENGVFKAIFSAALDFDDDFALHAAMIVVIKAGNVSFAPEFLMLCEPITNIIVSKRKTMGAAISAARVLSKYPLCAKKFYDLELDRVFKKLKKNPDYRKYAEEFLENLSVVQFY